MNHLWVGIRLLMWMLGSGELLFVSDSYGSLIETLGDGLPIELEAEVDRIDWSGEGVVICSSKGEFSSSTAIVIVSTGVRANRMRWISSWLDWKRPLVREFAIAS